MKIQSTKEVTWNNSKSTSKTVLMTGEILPQYDDNNTLSIEYKYVDSEGELYDHNKLVVTPEEGDLIYKAVKSKLPSITTVGHSAWRKALLLEGFKLKMAERFPELTVADIEIVQEEE